MRISPDKEKATDSAIKEAEQLLDQTRWTKEERQMFDEKRRRQDHYEATMAQIYYEHELAMEEKEKEGLEKGREELILTMLRNGVPAQILAQQTGIDESQIQAIADKNLV